jgi:hypothetical protein
MNIPQCLLSIIAFSLLYSCTKADALPVKVDEPHYLITSKKHRFDTFNGVDSIKHDYAYDEAGRLKEISRGGVTLQTITYSGPALVSVQYYTPTSPTTYDIYDVPNPFKVNTDSSEIKYKLGERADAQGFDTLYNIYTYTNNRITSYKNYNNSSQFSEPISAKFRYEYNSDSGLVKHRYSDQDQAEFVMADVLRTDDKKNPLTLLSKIDYIFISQPLNFISTSQSAHNITSYLDKDGNVEEIEYTYNSDGYPLTIKRKGDSFVMTEFEYALQ